MAKRRSAVLTARTADKYVLYTDAVQSPSADVEFLRRLFEQLNGRLPRVLREDFCGTAAICCQWAYTDAASRAIGVDVDPEPLAWACRHYLGLLPRECARRVRLRRADVLRVNTPGVDVICALNFSYCVFKRREVLVRYLTRCRQALSGGGVLVLDAYGGPRSQTPGLTRVRKRGYTYIWDRARWNPITGEVLNHMHFAFRDGSRMTKAFTYDWRLWTLPELADAMTEAGFGEARVYWENRDRRGRRTGVYQHRTRVTPETAWAAYIVGLKRAEGSPV